MHHILYSIHLFFRTANSNKQHGTPINLWNTLLCSASALLAVAVPANFCGKLDCTASFGEPLATWPCLDGWCIWCCCSSQQALPHNISSVQLYQQISSDFQILIPHESTTMRHLAPPLQRTPTLHRTTHSGGARDQVKNDLGMDEHRDQQNLKSGQITLPVAKAW